MKSKTIICLNTALAVTLVVEFIIGLKILFLCLNTALAVTLVVLQPLKTKIMKACLNTALAVTLVVNGYRVTTRTR